MAIVATQFTPSITRVPFLKPPDMQRMQTSMPRALVTFTLVGGTLDAKPINDQQTLNIGVNLPREFAYRMIDTETTIRQDVAFAWQFGGEMQITNAWRGEPLGLTTHHACIATAESFSINPIVQQTHWIVSRPTTSILQSISPGVAAGITFRFVNNTAPAGVAGVVLFFCRFFEYDIEQVQMFPPLVPAALTYSLSP